MMKQYILIMLLALAGLAGMAQTNEPLPGDAEPLTNQLYLSPSDSTVWAADPFSGLAIKVGTWFKVDSLFGLGYTRAQVDSAILSLRITPNIFKDQGFNDVEKIQKALDLAISLHQTLYIGYNEEEESSVWMLDSAILLRPGSDVEINNAKIKLKNTARDNIFRSDNIGIGVTSPVRTNNISIRGVGDAVIEGADIPRSTGDAAKELTVTPVEAGVTTFGTDAGVSGQRQYGDWRNIAILIGMCDGVEISGLSVIRSHAYAMSFERCTNGLVQNIRIDNPTRRVIAGEDTFVKNADGINLRYGINNFVVKDIYGMSGDDFIALTTLNGTYGPGTLETIMATGNEWTGFSDNTHNVTIEGVYAYSYTNLIRLLNIDDSKLSNVTIENVHDVSENVDSLYTPPVFGTRAAVIMGGGNSAEFGGTTPLGNLSNIYISNLSSYRYHNGVYVVGSLAESSITNYYKKNSTGAAAIYFDPVQSGGGRNVMVDNVNNADSAIWYSSVINGINNLRESYVGIDGVGPPLTSLTVDANNLGNRTSILYAGVSSTNLPTTSGGTGGVIIHTSAGTSLGNEFTLYGHRGAEDSFWFRRRFGANMNWYQVASRQFLSTNNTQHIQATQFRLSALNTPPASATATGTAGEIRFGTDGRIYICTATNTWIRSEPLTTWP